jgi:hypothetical protein
MPGLTLRREVAHASSVFHNQPGWPVVDVADKSIEEVTPEIIVLLGQVQPFAGGRSWPNANSLNRPSPTWKPSARCSATPSSM